MLILRFATLNYQNVYLYMVSQWEIFAKTNQYMYDGNILKFESI